MVSKRNFVTITSVMMVVCFLFLFPLFWRETRDPRNIHAPEGALPGEGEIWRQPGLTGTAQRYVAFLGDIAGSVGDAAVCWAEYTKTALAWVSSGTELSPPAARLPDAVIVEGGGLDLKTQLDCLLEWNRQGVTLIFAGLPPVAQLQKYPQFQTLLGIQSLTKASVRLEAIRLFSGFLLGGERIYSQRTRQDPLEMDLDSEAPWFQLTPETKVYLMGQVSVGELPEQEYRNERLPPLLWRRTLNGANVFVVNGDYLSGCTGIGILSAVMAEDLPYYLYPVVNAQVLTVANFPGMADENRDALVPRYGRGQKALVRDLLWPSLESMSETNGFPMSCFEMPQYRYDDGIEPEESLISFYLRLIGERNGEAGVSLPHDASVSLTDKWARDQAFLSLDATQYRYNAAFLTETELDEWSRNQEALGQFTAVSGSLGNRPGLFFFLDEDTLCQTVTHDLLNHSASDDLRLRSEQTALGYTNVMLDMLRVCWPEEGEPGWEVYYERSASNLHTYWQRFNEFDRLTVSESDRRIRSFLSMDYRQSREGNTITLAISPFQSGADFILRTHRETVSGVVGGTAKELERGAWLIHVSQPQAEITVEFDPRY